MTLTTRTNGSGPSNIVGASWWNDFKDFLTGVMQDQVGTIKHNLILQAIGGPPSTAPTLLLQSSGSMNIGNYQYVITFVSSDGGETFNSPVSSTVTTTSGNQKVNVTIITGPTGTTARNLYRTQANGTTLYYLTAINDNTTTLYVDTLADSSLNTSRYVPSRSTFGGSLKIEDQSGGLNCLLSSDGKINGGTYFLGTPYQLLLGGSISSTSTYICTGGTGVPIGAKAVLINAAFTSTTLNTFALFGPHGASFSHANYPASPLNQIGSSMVLTCSFPVPLDSNGQMDVKAVNGNCTSFDICIYGYVL